MVMGRGGAGSSRGQRRSCQQSVGFGLQGAEEAGLRESVGVVGDELPIGVRPIGDSSAVLRERMCDRTAGGFRGEDDDSLGKHRRGDPARIG